VTPLELQIEEHRVGLTSHCYRMLGSRFDAEDAVQDTLVRAWRGIQRFEGRAALGTWLYRIATNVCSDMLTARARRPSPMDLGSTEPAEASGGPVVAEDDPAEVVARREAIRAAFVVAVHHLPPGQRAVLLLRDVLRWTTAETAEFLGTSAPSVSSALQRARSRLAAVAASDASPSPADADRDLLARYVDAFVHEEVAALTSLIREDAARSFSRASGLRVAATLRAAAPPRPAGATRRAARCGREARSSPAPPEPRR
jgi:RNA polymerase sigma-70 factor (ECF subfamily)